MLKPGEFESFKASDWRRHPRVFRGAIDVSALHLAPADLCQLTSSDLVESRLVEQDYSVVHGPFEFTGPADGPLLEDGQMLMVQCLEQHLSQVSDLVDREFSFLPRWQIDDVMASFGYTAANCGAHFDHYDVFLLQLTGSKIWHLDQTSHTDTDLNPDADLRLLDDFEATDKLLLEPGDVLYIPPGRGHHGICQGESITLSVGIRNPTTSELLAEVSEFALEHGETLPLESQLHESNGGLAPDIGQELYADLSRMVSTEVLTKWYGCYVTRLRDPDLLQPGSVPALEGATIKAALASRLTWTGTDALILFINGECFELEIDAFEWISPLCLKRKARLPEEIPAAARETLAELFESGAILLAG